MNFKLKTVIHRQGSDPIIIIDDLLFPTTENKKIYINEQYWGDVTSLQDNIDLNEKTITRTFFLD